MRRVSAIGRTLPLLRLPPRVAWFFFRARRLAARTGDDWSLSSATHPESLAVLLRLARGRRHVVEIGTGTAWTTLALALADRRRVVRSYDPIARPERDRYLELAGPDAGARVELVDEPGERISREPDWRPELVFIDGSHERDMTVATFELWRALLAPGGIVAFHDRHNPLYPGVDEAIAQLGLDGEDRGDIFVWRAP
jgi:predicted O-methyltransferase YrrM